MLPKLDPFNRPFSFDELPLMPSERGRFNEIEREIKSLHILTWGVELVSFPTLHMRVKVHQTSDAKRIIEKVSSKCAYTTVTGLANGHKLIKIYIYHIKEKVDAR